MSQVQLALQQACDTGLWSVWRCLQRHLSIQLPSAGMKKKDLQAHLAWLHLQNEALVESSQL